MINQEKKFKETEIGFIPEEWGTSNMDSVCLKITDGSHFSPKVQKNGFHMASVKDMEENGFNLSQCKRISGEDFLKLVRQDCKPLAGDVLIAKDGSYLKSVFVNNKERDLVILSSIAILRPRKDKIVPAFLKYFLQNPKTKKDVASEYVSGAVLPRIVLNDFKKIKLALPSVSEQKKIADVLGMLDEKIELNRKMNQTLEEIGQAIFVNFLKKHHEQIGQGRFSAVATVATGKRPAEKTEGKTEDSLYPLIGAGSIMGYVKDFLYDEQLIITGRVGTHGGVMRVNFPCWPSDNALVITSRYPNYTYHLLRNFDFKSLNRGSTQPLITQTDINNYEVPILPEALLSDFENSVKNFYLQVECNDKQNQTLSSIRDSLLPKLMSGKARVR